MTLTGFGWWMGHPRKTVNQYSQTQEVFFNPLTGYAPSADYPEYMPESTLVYIDVTWREWEPEEGVYAWESVAEENFLERWRQEGKHGVLRFVCDVPSDEAHRDIPDWLYEKTGDGVDYDMEYGRGYSPEYNNPVFIEAHDRAIRALGEYLGQDTFISYVELGSLGHWGEWHVKYSAGLPRIPARPVREQYITPYLEAFPQVRMMMRRPFLAAAEHGLGLFNDMAGDQNSTEEWLGWIREGGDYSQAREKNALAAMPAVWDSAPIGGEFTSGIPMERMLGEMLEGTVTMIRDSHTTFLGPKTPDLSKEDQRPGAEEVMKNMGYRLYISRAEKRTARGGGSVDVTLDWHNAGVAPLYWDWPVCLYLFDQGGTVFASVPVELSLKELTAGESKQTLTRIPGNLIPDSPYSIGVGIEDPMTGQPAVYLAMDAPRQGRISVVLP